MQNQANLPIHPGGITSLSLQGFGQYIKFGEKEKIDIFLSNNIIVPRWFMKYEWGQIIEYHRSNFLPENLSLIKYEIQNFSIDISSPERAILECLYLVPKKWIWLNVIK